MSEKAIGAVLTAGIMILSGYELGEGVKCFTDRKYIRGGIYMALGVYCILLAAEIIFFG